MGQIIAKLFSPDVNIEPHLEFNNQMPMNNRVHAQANTDVRANIDAHVAEGGVLGRVREMNCLTGLREIQALPNCRSISLLEAVKKITGCERIEGIHVLERLEGISLSAFEAADCLIKMLPKLERISLLDALNDMSVIRKLRANAYVSDNHARAYVFDHVRHTSTGHHNIDIKINLSETVQVAIREGGHQLRLLGRTMLRSWRQQALPPLAPASPARIENPGERDRATVSWSPVAASCILGACGFALIHLTRADLSSSHPFSDRDLVAELNKFSLLEPVLAIGARLMMYAGARDDGRWPRTAAWPEHTLSTLSYMLASELAGAYAGPMAGLAACAGVAVGDWAAIPAIRQMLAPMGAYRLADGISQALQGPIDGQANGSNLSRLIPLACASAAAVASFRLTSPLSPQKTQAPVLFNDSLWRAGIKTQPGFTGSATMKSASMAYTGLMRDGKAHGLGTAVYREHLTFNGSFHEGFPISGHLVSSATPVFSAQLVKGKLVHIFFDIDTTVLNPVGVQKVYLFLRRHGIHIAEYIRENRHARNAIRQPLEA